jgi:hypothetical protein
MIAGLTLMQAQAVAGAIARIAQPDGTWTVYLPGDTLPPPPPPGPPPVPSQLTRRQFYRALMVKGWFGASKPAIDAVVDQLLTQLPDPPREVARVEWVESTAVFRAHPLLVQMWLALGRTLAELDEVFVLGETFPPAG